MPPTDSEWLKATSPKAGDNPAIAKVQLTTGEVWQLDAPVPVIGENGKIVADESITVYRMFELSTGAVDVFALPKVKSPTESVPAAFQFRLPATAIYRITRVVRMDVWKEIVAEMVELEQDGAGIVFLPDPEDEPDPDDDIVTETDTISTAPAPQPAPNGSVS